MVYVKVAFGFHAIYSTNYTRMLVDKLSRVLQVSWVLGKGFVEGVDEDGNLIRVWTDKTNSLIINAARYALLRGGAASQSFPLPRNNIVMLAWEGKPSQLNGFNYHFMIPKGTPRCRDGGDAGN